MKKNFYSVQWMAVSLLLLLLTSCAKEHTHTMVPADFIRQSEALNIPAAVALPSNAPYGNTRLATFYAVGVQKYKARQKAGSEQGQYEWVLAGPKADLYDESNSIVGMHAAGPYWKLFLGGIIEGAPFDPARSAPGTDANSIDWLLLQPKPGTFSSGIFQKTDYIQRIATTGGKAPAAAPLSLTDTVDVPYTAVYRFSRKNI